MAAFVLLSLAPRLLIKRKWRFVWMTWRGCSPWASGARSLA